MLVASQVIYLFCYVLTTATTVTATTTTTTTTAATTTTTTNTTIVTTFTLNSFNICRLFPYNICKMVDPANSWITVPEKCVHKGSRL